MFKHLEQEEDADHDWNFSKAVKAELAANGWGEKNTHALLNYQLPHLLCLEEDDYKLLRSQLLPLKPFEYLEFIKKLISDQTTGGSDMQPIFDGCGPALSLLLWTP